MTFYCIVALFVQNTGSALHGKYRNKNKYKMTQLSIPTHAQLQRL